MNREKNNASGRAEVLEVSLAVVVVVNSLEKQRQKMGKTSDVYLNSLYAFLKLVFIYSVFVWRMLLVSCLFG
jgi:hypothetical protein